MGSYQEPSLGLLDSAVFPCYSGSDRLDGFGVLEFKDSDSAAAAIPKIIAGDTSVEEWKESSDPGRQPRGGRLNPDLGPGARCAQLPDGNVSFYEICLLPRGRFLLVGTGRNDQYAAGEEAAKAAVRWFNSAAR